MSSSTDRPLPSPSYTPRSSQADQPPAPDQEQPDDNAVDAGKAVLSRELADLLVELSIALQKHAIYPAGHPLLDDAIEGVLGMISSLLGERPSLSLGIARRQLIITVPCAGACYGVMCVSAERLSG